MLTPGLNLPFGIQPVNPVPVDSNYGPYADVAEAVAAIPLALRYDGLTVQITGSGNYWWIAADLSDLGLVPKESGGASGLPAVLLIDNTTSGKDIQLTTTDQITSSSLTSALYLDDGFQGTALSADGIQLDTAWTWNSSTYYPTYYPLTGIKNWSELAAVDAGDTGYGQVALYTTLGSIDNWNPKDYLMVQSRRSILLTKYDWSLNIVQGGLSYSSGGGNGDGSFELTTTETYQKGLNIINDMAFYLDGGNNIDIDGAVDKVLVTKGWVTAQLSGTSGLPSVLTINNTTGANNIIVNTTQNIRSGNGGGQLDLDYGGDAGAVVLSTDNGALSETWLQLSTSQSGIFWNGIGLTIDSVNGTMLSYGTSYLRVYPDGNIKLDAANKVIIQTPTVLQYIDGNQSSGKVLTSDASGNASWQTTPTAVSYILTPADKFMVALDTVGDDAIATSSTITHTPVDGCYVAVMYNGVEYEVGNGVTTKVFYFSNVEGGGVARGFSSSHPNGQVQAGDFLYFNESVAGFVLQSGARISLMYMVTN